ncbi:hypothetical protein [Legionella pneumophila]|uniref:hypothetical protein n=1 Tax=Legionella pneumophila TaxID=446 RepID=UPI001F24200C|nr:hypothetical protein [Legionella pneumophila]
MIFIEIPIFTEDVKELLSDEEYAEFQEYLADNPLAGDVIQQTGKLANWQTGKLANWQTGKLANWRTAKSSMIISRQSEARRC